MFHGSSLHRSSLQFSRSRNRPFRQFRNQAFQELRIIAVLIKELFKLGYPFFYQRPWRHAHAYLVVGSLAQKSLGNQTISEKKSLL